MAPGDLLGILSRCVHIGSVIVLLGGVIYHRMVLFPAMGSLSRPESAALAERVASSLRRSVPFAAAAILASGLYNLLSKSNIPPGYHMAFGIKMLLVLHVFSVGFLAGKPGVEPARRGRWMGGMAVSGLAIVVLSAYLRWLSR